MNLTIAEPGPRTIQNVCGAINCVVVIVSGRPVVIQPYVKLMDAVVAAWLPGTEGQGVADVLFGDYGFTGKLSRTWFKTVDQLPMNVGDRHYDPLFPFGFGLATQPIKAQMLLFKQEEKGNLLTFDKKNKSDADVYQVQLQVCYCQLQSQQQMDSLQLLSYDKNKTPSSLNISGSFLSLHVILQSFLFRETLKVQHWYTQNDMITDEKRHCKSHCPKSDGVLF